MSGKIRKRGHSRLTLLHNKTIKKTPERIANTYRVLKVCRALVLVLYTHTHTHSLKILIKALWAGAVMSGASKGLTTGYLVGRGGPAL